MPEPTMQEILAVLENDWGNYVQAFEALPPAAREAFLQSQGYRRLEDLLAHVQAWWEQGIQLIQLYRRDPQARHPEVDVDVFNAAAVTQASSLPGELVRQSFEASRQNFGEVIRSLSEQDLLDERILTQLRMELLNHLEEHRLPRP